MMDGRSEIFECIECMLIPRMDGKRNSIPPCKITSWVEHGPNMTKFCFSGNCWNFMGCPCQIPNPQVSIKTYGKVPIFHPMSYLRIAWVCVGLPLATWAQAAIPEVLNAAFKT